MNTTGFGAPKEEDDEANDSDLFGDNSEADSEEYPYSDQERRLNFKALTLDIVNVRYRDTKHTARLYWE